MIEESYSIAKKAYDKTIGIVEGAEYLSREYNINDASAKDYINNFRHMRNGDQYTRTMNGTATRYYLQKIFDDYGYNGLQIALQSVNSHIDYYESLDHGRLNNIRKIHDDFMKIKKQENFYNEHNDEKEEYFNEGKVKQVFINIYERDKDARKKCIEYYGYKCYTCGLVLSNIYGEIAENFIHVHHIIELSSIKKEYIVDPINDLRPLCPNCHAIVHRKSPALSIEELINIINENTK
jgi:5-methylcytosine-specific restriction protein A